MHRQQFHYDLPKELIASTPTPKRSGSRLLVMEAASGGLEHKSFGDIVDYLNPGDLLVFNDTQVIPARLQGQKKESGGKVEILIERIIEPHTALAQVRASKSPKAGSELEVQGVKTLTVVDRQGDFFLLDFHEPVLDVLARSGEMPLPPYMERSAESMDSERYQTVYAKEPGAVAAPTAGLHFDEELLNRLKEKGVESAFLTLHVGAGTFQPIRVDVLKEHQMHREWMHLSPDVCAKINRCKASGRRVIAVGTTSVRALESAAKNGELQPYTGETQIFIYPPYTFQVVDALITNFHLPESTLLMLVSAFAGSEPVLNAYHTAVENRYRFFSYGDAMFVSRRLEGGLDGQ